MAGMLNIGVSGLNAAQAQLNTTSHNITNAGTTGYHRQTVSQGAREPLFHLSTVAARSTRQNRGSCPTAKLTRMSVVGVGWAWNSEPGAATCEAGPMPNSAVIARKLASQARCSRRIAFGLPLLPEEKPR